jgi:predicted HTH transcriptional regulator
MVHSSRRGCHGCNTASLPDVPGDDARAAFQGLSRDERLALVLTRREGTVTKRRLRLEFDERANVHAVVDGLLAKGLLRQIGQRGGTRYVLSQEVIIRTGESGMVAQSRRRQQLLDELRRRGSLSTSEGARLLSEDRRHVRDLLNGLVREGLAEPRGRTSARRYFASRS